MGRLLLTPRPSNPQALHERENLMHIGPHLSSSLPILLPLYSWLEVPRCWIGLARAPRPPRPTPPVKCRCGKPPHNQVFQDKNI